ncbi:MULTISPECIES: class I SAM-dependent methyltransferase [Pseudonocardia]|uniref:Methyltransferase type 11 domain-containing protein n=2 Tax=Pseudonocardia TaxID=1847 RepID=A0ABQ0S1K2_9PSEU|nr:MULTISPECIES: class I SAM-dependent methyltransferase [Pseudonocardia]OSY36733.1 putative S-adenosylmethionine-dependent methyltransferase [Pseudonocardia autotrophica]TDN77152.1 methyltransferase family protein [Pseudonocardia autotrophica]BBG01157.1 hypothetical protein Pdca_23660 [Pseudonocardia autotrophica]GEC26787.1 hypothetical protein PSA01_38160 [Pseudonocardia saturnea]
MPARTAYHGSLGDLFARHAGTSPYNAAVDRPAMIELAGPVAGLTVLDVGCGAGHHAAELGARGARMIGFDGSETLLGHARRRLGDAAELHLHDAEEPLHFLPDGSVDGVLCALVYHHVSRRRELLAELRRVLRPGGWLLVSTSHPAGDWQHFGDSYFSEDWVDLPLGDSGESIHYQRMTLEVFLGELLGAGFALERLVEPRPVDPALERLRRAPSFVAVRMVRP